MRTSAHELRQDAVEAFIEALDDAGLVAVPAGAESDADVVLDGPAGPVEIDLLAMTVVDPTRVSSLTEERRKGRGRGTVPDDRLRVVVADQISEPARELLRRSGWGYLDRRGALWLRGHGLFINDTSLPSLSRHRAAPSGAIRGRVGLGVALFLLVHVGQAKASVRQIAGAIGASPSTVHDALAVLRDQALVDGDGTPLVPDLFEALSEAWTPTRVSVRREPNPGGPDLGFGFHHEDDPSRLSPQGWVVSGDLAAAALGAPIVVGSGVAPDFYVPTPALLSRAVRTLGGCGYQERGATLAVAPSPLVTGLRQDPDSLATPSLSWPIAHPVVVALDLSKDLSRGGEIILEWNPKGVIRVW